MDNMSTPKGVALVTGSDRGIGKGIAIALTRAHYRVAINYLDEPTRANDTVAELTATGGDAIAIQANVSVSADVQRMVQTVVEHFGRIDLLVNNAGTQVWAPLLELSEADWDRVIDTNLKGCFLCTQAAARQMRQQGGGGIINIGSGCNKVPFPELVSYTASKGGIEMLTKVSALELGPFGIRVNCVAPGAIEVERTKLERADYAGTWSRVTPLRRIGTPADIGQTVVLLASPEASFITGQTVGVDGGLFNQPPWPPET
jgi:NAD(P)-dependent dehydrogenase (short-subunit alcohol dehydrogenase family)